MGLRYRGRPAPRRSAWFDDGESFQRALESPEAKAAFGDAPSFMDMERLPSFAVAEVEVV